MSGDNVPTVDLTQAVVLMSAYLDDDGPAVDAILASTESGVLAHQLFWLAVQLGRQASNGNEDALRDGLCNALVGTIQVEQEGS